MNNFDINKSQVQAFGNHQVERNAVPQGNLFRDLVSEMTSSGKWEDAVKMICDMVEDLEKRVKELEQK